MTDEAKLKPMDRHNEALLANVHPPALINPQPTGRYNMVVIGGRPIGCELDQAFARLGSEVTICQRRSQLLPREDPDVGTIGEASVSRADR